MILVLAGPPVAVGAEQLVGQPQPGVGGTCHEIDPDGVDEAPASQRVDETDVPGVLGLVAPLQHEAINRILAFQHR